MYLCRRGPVGRPGVDQLCGIPPRTSRRGCGGTRFPNIVPRQRCGACWYSPSETRFESRHGPPSRRLKSNKKNPEVLYFNFAQSQRAYSLVCSVLLFQLNKNLVSPSINLILFLGRKKLNHFWKKTQATGGLGHCNLQVYVQKKPVLHSFLIQKPLKKLCLISRFRLNV